MAGSSGRDSLSPIDPDKLTGLARDRADEFDQLAVNEAGLARVVAAALTDRDTPLSVQLPQHVIARPPQVGVRVHCCGGCGGRSGHYSAAIPDGGVGHSLPMSHHWAIWTREPWRSIVFRTSQAMQPGLSTRREVLVRPAQTIEPSAAAPYQAFATLLVDAYRYLGGRELTRHLEAVGAEYPSADKRIEGMQAMLWDALPAVALSAPSPQYMPVAESMLREPVDGPPSDANLTPVENRVPWELRWGHRLRLAADASAVGWGVAAPCRGRLGRGRPGRSGESC